MNNADTSSQYFFQWNRRTKSNKFLFILHYLIYGIVPALVIFSLFIDVAWHMVLISLVVLVYVLMALRFEHETFSFKNTQTLILFIPFLLDVWYVRSGFVVQGGGKLLVFLQIYSIILFVGILISLTVALFVYVYRHFRSNLGKLLLLCFLVFVWILFDILFFKTPTVLYQAEELHTWGIMKFVMLVALVFIFHFREVLTMARANRI